jgi:hypothetical protein
MSMICDGGLLDVLTVLASPYAVTSVSARSPSTSKVVLATPARNPLGELRPSFA